MVKKRLSEHQVQRYFWAMDQQQSTELLKWYDQVKRDLPWRHSTNPYVIWVSEIILQQTRVDQGLPYYKRFIDKFPDVHSLADSEEDSVLKLWEGLGYYSRARNMRFAAKQVVHDLKGQFPTSYSEIIKLKGIGPYTAAAISSIAFNEPKASVDGNVLRVMSRMLATERSIDDQKTKTWFEGYLNKSISKERPGDFNQAMMELGATLCQPKQANCDDCPLRAKCKAHQLGTELAFPIRTKKAKKRNRFFIYLNIECGGTTFITRRSEGDIWQGLYEFPMVEVDSELAFKDPIKTLSERGVWQASFILESVSSAFKHMLSHQNIKAVVVKVRSDDNLNMNDMIRCKPEELSNFAMPRLITQYLEKGT